MASPPRLRIIKEVAEGLGLSELAELEAFLVRHRPPPPRLLAALLLEEDGLPLTERQRDVLARLAAGYSRQEIANDLGVGEQTVKSHLATIYKRLGVNNRIQAVNAFLERDRG